jgi:hypothetical protein
VRRTTVASELQLNCSLDSQISETHLNVSSILNSQEQIENQQSAEKRRKDFKGICAELRHAQHNPEVPDSMQSLLAPLARCA